MWTRQVRLFRFSLEVLESDRTVIVQSVTQQGQLHWENAIHHCMCESAVCVWGGAQEGVKKVP